MSDTSFNPVQFQSTRPVWGATSVVRQDRLPRSISIHAPRVGRDAFFRELRKAYAISIHAPRVGRDSFSCLRLLTRGNFNPRAPCGARRWVWQGWSAHSSFQSTRPVWGATFWPSVNPFNQVKFQSTRPVWGATRGFTFPAESVKISIHAPRVGRDSFEDSITLHLQISIHAPRVGRDVVRICLPQ